MKTGYDVLQEVESKFTGEVVDVDFNKNYSAYDIMCNIKSVGEILETINKDATKIFELARWEISDQEGQILSIDRINTIMDAIENVTDYTENTIDKIHFIATRSFVYIWGEIDNNSFLLTTYATMDECGDAVWRTRFQLFNN